MGSGRHSITCSRGGRRFRLPVPTKLCGKFRTKEAPSPALLNPAVPKDLETICLKCLEKDPAKRYSSAAEIAEELRRFERGEPIHARPIARVERAWRLCRRNPLISALSGAVALALVLGTAISTWQAIRATNAQGRAERERNLKDVALRRTQQSLLAEQQAKAAEAAQRKRAEATSTYLSNVFRSPDPQRDGRTITVAELLDRTRDDLANQFQDDPETKSGLLIALAEAYGGLGLYLDAVKLRQQAFDLGAARRDSQDTGSVDAMQELAAAYWKAGKIKDAIVYYENILKSRRATLGPQHADTHLAMYNLSAAYSNDERFDDAVALSEEVLRLNQANHAAGDEALLMPMSRLARSYLEAGRKNDAARIMNEMIALDQAAAPDQRFASDSWNERASLYWNAGRLDMALPLYQKILKFHKGDFGTDHPKTLTTMHNVGALYWATKKHEQAIALWQETLKFKREKLGPDHPDTIATQQILAMCLGSQNRPQEAVPLLESMFLSLKKRLGADHPDTLTTMKNLAVAYGGTQQRKRAIQMLEEMLELSTKKLGEDHEQTLETMQTLALYYDSEKRVDESLALYRQVYERTNTKLGPDHENTNFARRSLADAYQRNGKLKEAAELRANAASIVEGPNSPTDGGRAAQGKWPLQIRDFRSTSDQFAPGDKVPFSGTLVNCQQHRFIS